MQVFVSTERKQSALRKIDYHLVVNADSTELQNFSEFNNLRNLRHIQFQTTATKSRAEKQSFFDEKIPSSTSSSASLRLRAQQFYSYLKTSRLSDFPILAFNLPTFHPKKSPTMIQFANIQNFRIILDMEHAEIDRDDFRRLLAEIAAMRMPYGKFGPKECPPAGVWICDLPIEYLAWFKERGFPKDRLGELLSAVYDIKSHGMDSLFDPIRQSHGGRSPLRPKRPKKFTFE